jgi:hypothetical protein
LKDTIRAIESECYAPDAEPKDSVDQDTIETANQRRFYVFDAKYRSSRQSILHAMTSAHVYRDSLRWDDVRPDMSLLLVPEVNQVAWLQDDGFQYSEGVGVAKLAPSFVQDIIYQLGIVG